MTDQPTNHLRWIALAVLLFAAGSALADPKSEAKKHLALASKAHAEARYDDALKELNIAYTLDPQPALLYAIGQVHVMQGRCAEAITFYDRFVATQPDASQAAKATEAIATCKKLLQPAKPIEPVVVVKQPERPIAPPRREVRPWYTDKLGDALVVGGTISGITGIVMWRSALSDRDRADAEPAYEGYDDLVRKAKTKQTVAIVLGASGVALVGAGLVSYLTRSRERVMLGVVPSDGGASITWSGGF